MLSRLSASHPHFLPAAHPALHRRPHALTLRTKQSSESFRRFLAEASEGATTSGPASARTTMVGRTGRSATSGTKSVLCPAPVAMTMTIAHSGLSARRRKAAKEALPVGGVRLWPFQHDPNGAHGDVAMKLDVRTQIQYHGGRSCRHAWPQGMHGGARP